MSRSTTRVNKSFGTVDPITKELGPSFTELIEYDGGNEWVESDTIIHEGGDVTIHLRELIGREGGTTYCIQLLNTHPSDNFEMNNVYGGVLTCAKYQNHVECRKLILQDVDEFAYDSDLDTILDAKVKHEHAHAGRFMLGVSGGELEVRFELPKREAVSIKQLVDGIYPSIAVKTYKATWSASNGTNVDPVGLSDDFIQEMFEGTSPADLANDKNGMIIAFLTERLSDVIG